MSADDRHPYTDQPYDPDWTAEAAIEAAQAVGEPRHWSTMMADLEAAYAAGEHAREGAYRLRHWIRTGATYPTLGADRRADQLARIIAALDAASVELLAELRRQWPDDTPRPADTNPAPTLRMLADRADGHEQAARVREEYAAACRRKAAR